MTKGQRRGNREIRMPKANKPTAAAALAEFKGHRPCVISAESQGAAC
jgi:hypothetical protein